MEGTFQNLMNWSLFKYFSGVHYCYPVAEVIGQLKIMSYYKCTGSGFMAQLPQNFRYLVSGYGIQPFGRLISYQQ